MGFLKARVTDAINDLFDALDTANERIGDWFAGPEDQ